MQLENREHVQAEDIGELHASRDTIIDAVRLLHEEASRSTDVGALCEARDTILSALRVVRGDVSEAEFKERRSIAYAADPAPLIMSMIQSACERKSDFYSHSLPEGAPWLRLFQTLNSTQQADAMMRIWHSEDPALEEQVYRYPSFRNSQGTISLRDALTEKMSFYVVQDFYRTASGSALNELIERCADDRMLILLSEDLCNQFPRFQQTVPIEDQLKAVMQRLSSEAQSEETRTIIGKQLETKVVLPWEWKYPQLRGLLGSQ